MKIISWNVNGIRAIVKKDFYALTDVMDADVYCFQETKADPSQVGEALQSMLGYTVYANSAERKGYSGTAIACRTAPINVSYDMGFEEHDAEGRVVTAEYPDFYLVNVYTPNSGAELMRLGYRQAWDKAFFEFIKGLERSKPVLVCGDLNVAHTRYRPGQSRCQLQQVGRVHAAGDRRSGALSGGGAGRYVQVFQS